MDNQNKIFLGYDQREELAYEVARHSIVSRSKDVQIEPLDLRDLGHILTRPIERVDGRLWCPISGAPMATEFAISRFCIPFLQSDGWALFADCDIVCKAPISELFALADDQYAVMVVKHQVPYDIVKVKMDGCQQLHYRRKLWSSIVLWNVSHPSHRHLTKKVLNNWPGRDLHAFHWLPDSEIGELPHEWNFLVGIDDASKVQKSDIKIFHYTHGGPWFEQCRNCEYADVWYDEWQAYENARVMSECLH